MPSVALMRLSPVWTRWRKQAGRTKDIYAREAILAHLEDTRRIIIFQQKLRVRRGDEAVHSVERREEVAVWTIAIPSGALKSLRKMDKQNDGLWIARRLHCSCCRSRQSGSRSKTSWASSAIGWEIIAFCVRSEMTSLLSLATTIGHRREVYD